MNIDTTHTNGASTTEQSVSSSVLHQIESGNIKPRSRWFFRSRECVIWFLWFVTVVVGAAAVAVTMYVSLSVPYMLYEATHANLLTASISMLPYLWIGIFALMAYLAIVNLRHTKRGYRYRTIELLGSSVLASMVVGVGLQVAGGGYVMDQTLGSLIAAYPSYEKKRLTLWQAPEEGRMVGTLLPIENAPGIQSDDQQFVFHDIDEQVWQVDVSELGERDLSLLHDNGATRVRVVGTSTAPQVFHLCGVFAWRSDEQLTREALQNERQLFLQSIQAHVMADADDAPVDPATQGPSAAEEGEMVNAASAEASGHPCRDIEAVRRAEHHFTE